MSVRACVCVCLCEETLLQGGKVSTVYTRIRVARKVHASVLFFFSFLVFHSKHIFILLLPAFRVKIAAMYLMRAHETFIMRGVVFFSLLHFIACHHHPYHAGC